MGGRQRRLLGLVVVVIVVAGGAVASGAASRACSALKAAGWNLDIERALDAAGIQPGMVVGEAGAGDGYFTIPMARRVGVGGAVYANDISRRALDQVASAARREHLGHVHTVEGTVTDAKFPRHDLDMVVIVHAFHDFSEPVAWLRNVRQYLKPGAPIVIIDRDPDQGAEHHFWSRDRIAGYTTDAGFDTVKVIDVSSRHMVVVIRPRT